MEIKKYFISQRIFGREYRLLIKRGNSGFLLGELLISTTVICIAMGGLIKLNVSLFAMGTTMANRK